MNKNLLLKISTVLWGIWGVFHLLIGVLMVATFSGSDSEGNLKAIPVVLDFVMNGMSMPFPILASLKQHAFNLGWIGAVVTIGSYYIWKKKPNTIILCAIVGGFADLGYFIFVDLAGYAQPPATQMTWISASAIILSLYVYFTTDKLSTL
ncbi:MAG: hypothetical protein HQ509_00340 [Candidatus Marinimicrobia bacterium]|nr:hypothetical protein [Candidatus Neomarinimicrobiota bacterium]